MIERVIIDTREDYEYAQSHVEGAINIPPNEFMQDELPSVLSELEKDTEIVVYCRSGQRSNTVGQILRMHGFTNIINGINENRVAKVLEL